MYESFYGLRVRPFGKTPDPAFLWEGPTHAEALARLELAAHDKEVAVLTGDVGTGKTTLTRALIDRLGDSFKIVLLINPRLSPAELLAFIAERLGVQTPARTKTKLYDALTGRLFALYEAGETPLIIVDEAHLIPTRAVFEELRLLMNLQLDDAQLLGLLLVGQPELRERLAKKDLKSFVQRVGVAYHLRPLTRQDVGSYIAHRLAVAGREEPLFEEGALDIVHEASGGVPRRINVICQAALLVGFGNQSSRIDHAIIEDVWNDLRTHLGVAFDGAG